MLEPQVVVQVAGFVTVDDEGAVLSAAHRGGRGFGRDVEVALVAVFVEGAAHTPMLRRVVLERTFLVPGPGIEVVGAPRGAPLWVRKRVVFPTRNEMSMQIRIVVVAMVSLFAVEMGAQERGREREIPRLEQHEEKSFAGHLEGDVAGVTFLLDDFLLQVKDKNNQSSVSEKLSYLL